MEIRFYRDESHNGKPKNPETLTISGFFSDQLTWNKSRNRGFQIDADMECRFSCIRLGPRKERYLGWSKETKKLQLRITRSRGISEGAHVAITGGCVPTHTGTSSARRTNEN